MKEKSEKEHGGHNLRGMRIEVHRDKERKVTGYTVHHEAEYKPSKSGAFTVGQENVSQPFSHKEGGAMIEHVSRTLGIGHHEEDEQGEEYKGKGY